MIHHSHIIFIACRHSEHQHIYKRKEGNLMRFFQCFSLLFFRSVYIYQVKLRSRKKLIENKKKIKQQTNKMKIVKHFVWTPNSFNFSGKRCRALRFLFVVKWTLNFLLSYLCFIRFHSVVCVSVLCVYWQRYTQWNNIRKTWNFAFFAYIWKNKNNNN